MSYDLAQLILAKGLGEASVVLAEVTALDLNAVSNKIIKPQVPWHYAVVHRMTLALHPPRETGRSISKVGSGSASVAGSYTSIATWQISAGRFGALREVSLDSDNFAKTQWQLVLPGIRDVTLGEGWIDKVFRSPLTIPFPETNIPATEWVNVLAGSTDGTTITAYASISGKEWAPYVFTLKLRKQGGVTSHTLYSSSALIQQGFPMWAYISDTDPLYLDITNTNGESLIASGGGEYFLAHFEVINTDETRLNEIIRITRQMGLPEAVQMVTPIPDPARLAFARRS